MVGQTLGKYRVEERIGRGGMGTVYRAVDETLHREVALKVLNTDLHDKSVGRRFRAEAVAIARLNHPGIATIYELLEHDGQWLMVMEFVRGETLEDLVLRAGPLSPDRAIDLVSQALAALAHAHGMAVVHRDLKPANLMVSESGRLKVMDFGIARVAGTEHLTSAGFMMGTPAYMAPEQVLGRDVDARADLYAIGCVLYFLLSGRLPFEGATPMETAQSRLRDEPTPILTLRADLPPWIADILRRVLAREPADRFQHAEEFRDALARGLSGLPIAPPANDVMETVLPGALPAPPPRSPSASLPRPVAPSENLSTAETQLMGTGPRAVPNRPATPPPNPGPSGPVSLPFDPNTAETIVAQAPAGVRQSQPVPVVHPGTPTAGAKPKSQKPRTSPSVNPYVLGGAAAVLALLLAVWLWPRSGPSEPPAAVPPPVDPGATSPVTPPADPPPPVAPPVEPPPVLTSPPASPPPTSSPPPSASTKPGPPSTTPAGGSSPRSGRPAAPEIAVTFDRVRMLKITGRRAEDVDAELQFGNGHVAILPKRDSTPGVAHAYKDVLRATYVRGRDPQWAPNLPVPPDNLDMPSGLFGRRSDRHWLALQGATWFLIVSLEDNWEQVLHTVTERTRVKIDRPAPAKD
jgi:serine/threonine-protein kinase